MPDTSPLPTIHGNRLREVTIAYVADTVRDAETLAQTIDAPIIIRERVMSRKTSSTSLPARGLKG